MTLSGAVHFTNRACLRTRPVFCVPDMTDDLMAGCGTVFPGAGRTGVRFRSGAVVAGVFHCPVPGVRSIQPRFESKLIRNDAESGGPNR